jgi:hypothetical protein
VSSELWSRARQINERSLLRSWKFRQRHHSAGVWFRVPRALVDLGGLWPISEDDAKELEAEEFTSLGAGQELEPPLRIYVLTPERVQRLRVDQPLPVRLSAAVLSAGQLAAVRIGAETP